MSPFQFYRHICTYIFREVALFQFYQLKRFIRLFISYLLFDTLSQDGLAQSDSRHDI